MNAMYSAVSRGGQTGQTARTDRPETAFLTVCERTKPGRAEPARTVENYVPNTGWRGGDREPARHGPPNRDEPARHGTPNRHGPCNAFSCFTCLHVLQKFSSYISLIDFSFVD